MDGEEAFAMIERFFAFESERLTSAEEGQLPSAGQAR